MPLLIPLLTPLFNTILNTLWMPLLIPVVIPFWKPLLTSLQYYRVSIPLLWIPLLLQLLMNTLNNTRTTTERFREKKLHETLSYATRWTIKPRQLLTPFYFLDQELWQIRTYKNLLSVVVLHNIEGSIEGLSYVSTVRRALLGKLAVPRLRSASADEMMLS